MDYVMGIDLGSTSLKAMVYGLDGAAIASGSRPTEKFHPDSEHPEWAVWQPEQIWGDTAAAIRDAVAALDDPRHIKAVAVTGMGMDGLPIDSGRQVALSDDLLARSSHRRAASLVAGKYHRRKGLFDRR